MSDTLQKEEGDKLKEPSRVLESIAKFEGRQRRTSIKRENERGF